MLLTGDKIRQARMRQRLSQAELARRLGVKQPSISRIERGQKPSGAVQLLLVQWIANGEAAA